MTAGIPPAGLDPEPLSRITVSGDPKEAYAQGVADGAAAERDRIRLALLACQDCGAVHQLHQVQGRWNDGKPYRGTSWAAADGHAYRTRFHGTNVRQFVADLLDGAP